MNARYKRIMIGILLCLILFLCTPFMAWWAEDSKQVELVVVDKTVPQDDYREHLGLFWVLDHLKVERADGSNYRLDRDYYGYHPEELRGDKELEIGLPPDVIYVTDTYGVYSTDLDENPSGDRSTLLYGGLTLFEWNRIMSAKTPQTRLLMEFDSIASPTEPLVRRIVEDNMGMTWSGWIGRFFPDLASEEVPEWMRTNYEAQFGEPWHFQGEGIVFVDEADRVVIMNDEDFQGRVRFKWTEAGRMHVPEGRDSEYLYWFDIIKPKQGVLTEAEYRVDWSEEAKARLTGFGIPLVYPAVIHSPERNIYYFAGDFSDMTTNDMRKWRMPDLFYAFMGNMRKDEQFFWEAYIPLMEQILEEASGRKKG